MNPRLDRYFESEVLSADPVKLVTILYRAAREAVAGAGVALAGGDIPARSKHILKAWEIVHELRGSLNHEQGGEISRQLEELYDYVSQRLLDANAEQSQKALDEAGAVLAILAEAWQGVQAKQVQPLVVAC
jgi:flagellar secretion chaperone FliS